MVESNKPGMKIFALVCLFFHCIFFLPFNGFANIERTAHNAPASNIIDKPFRQAVAFVEVNVEKLHEQLKGFGLLAETIGNQWSLIDQSGSPGTLLALILMTITLSILLEWLIRKLLSGPHQSFSNYPQEKYLSRFWATFGAVALETVYALTYILASFVIYIVALPKSGHAEVIASNYMIAGYYIRLLLYVASIFLAPAYKSLRIFPYSDEAARFMFFWITILCGLEIFLVRSGIILRQLKGPENAFLALVGITISSTFVALVCMIIISRKRVAESLQSSQKHSMTITKIQDMLFKHWHVAALILVFAITCIWELRVLGSGRVLFGRVIVGLLAIPLFGALDIWGNRLFSKLQNSLKKNTPTAPGEAIQAGTFNIIKIVAYFQLVYRLLLLILLVFLLLGLWNLEIPYGKMFTGSMLGFVSIVVVFYMFWQFFSGWIDRRIYQEMPQDRDEADEGGKGGSRIGTLLILLRKFVFILLIISAIFFTLSTFGVNIGPLVAGAGIIGLAISFGAQSLVTDIFAGIFFLVDDAFRVGDYIDIGTAKGSVEQISLRSVRLRHHRGMVQTIPFGKIDTVTNYSRDYIITKFDLRIRYDTDIEKVRKIIKKIYMDLLDDESFGPRLIGKLKSQGIRQMDDSAMIVRVKFTTPPGEQFILRKEIYRRIQESFAANDIEFAHRNVTVYMPKEQEVHDRMADNTIAGAAAIENENREQKNSSQDR